jgi:hypothetical protein
MGEYSTAPATWGRTLGQLGVGLTPVGIAADIRDWSKSAADLRNGSGSWAQMAVSTVFLIPGASELGKVGKLGNGLIGITPQGGRAIGAARGTPTGKPPIIIGENMKRVQAYADQVGGHAYRPWKLDPWDPATAMRRNERWILDQRRAGREVIDIGPDFERRATTGYISDFYEMERRNLTGYDNYQKVFERSGSTGGVPGLDF